MDKDKVSDFLNVYHAAVPQFHADAQQHAVGAAQGLGLADVSALGSFQKIEDDICKSWAGTRSFMLSAIGSIGWVPGISGYAAKARAIIEAVDKTIIPVVCAADAPLADHSKPPIQTPTKKS